MITNKIFGRRKKNQVICTMNVDAYVWFSALNNMIQVNMACQRIATLNHSNYYCHSQGKEKSRSVAVRIKRYNRTNGVPEPIWPDDEPLPEGKQYKQRLIDLELSIWEEFGSEGAGHFSSQIRIASHLYHHSVEGTHTPGQYEVTDPNANDKFAVHVNGDPKCACLFRAAHKVPCWHLIAVLFKRSISKPLGWDDAAKALRACMMKRWTPDVADESVLVTMRVSE